LTGVDGTVRLELQDDGKGIDPAPEGAPKTFGVLGMRERASILGGELTINSTPGAGTSVVMTIPRAGNRRKVSR
jgi:signal transduction histidine kinase